MESAPKGQPVQAGSPKTVRRWTPENTNSTSQLKIPSARIMSQVGTMMLFCSAKAWKCSFWVAFLACYVFVFPHDIFCFRKGICTTDQSSGSHCIGSTWSSWNPATSFLHWCLWLSITQRTNWVHSLPEQLWLSVSDLLQLEEVL